MRMTTKRTAEILESLVNPLAAIAVVLALVIFFFHILTHFPFFDETMRVRFLWLMSSGLKPNVDYFTPHPSLGYLLTQPFMRLFPGSSIAVLALRCLSLVLFLAMGALLSLHGWKVRRDWALGLIPFLLVATAPAISSYAAEFSIDHLAALAALGAGVLLFTEPTPWKTGVLSALSCVSLLIMPKYLPPLLLGVAGYLVAAYRSPGRFFVMIGAAAAGLLLSVLAVALLFQHNGLSLPFDISHTHLLHARLASSGNHNVVSAGSPSTLRYVAEHLLLNPVLAVVVLLGIGGWIRHARQEGGRVLWAGGGFLLGALIASLLTRSFFEQYVTPVLLCLVLYAPYAFSGIRSGMGLTTLRLVLVVSALATLTVHFGDATKEFRKTPYNGRGNTPIHRRVLGSVAMSNPGISILADYDQILSMIPPNETVAAVWPRHPLFRRDVTFVTFDDVPTHMLGLPPDDAVRRQFDPENFLQALESKPPAFIAPAGMEINYPAGWQRVALDFLERHQGRYVAFAGGYLRRDLFPGHEKDDGRR